MFQLLPSPRRLTLNLGGGGDNLCKALAVGTNLFRWRRGGGGKVRLLVSLGEHAACFLFELLGRAVQIEPIKPAFKVPGTKRLKLKHHKLLSISLQFCFYIQLAPLQLGLGQAVCLTLGEAWYRVLCRVYRGNRLSIYLSLSLALTTLLFVQVV